MNLLIMVMIQLSHIHQEGLSARVLVKAETLNDKCEKVVEEKDDDDDDDEKERQAQSGFYQKFAIVRGAKREYK